MKEIIDVMEYHQSDLRWEIFGMPDFQSFQQQLVVKGLFHPLVPKDIIEAYEVAEYMMAHAYYHYPLYDEAFSKLLRITEMAVKLRCKQLGIALETNKINKKTNQPEKKVLDALIKELSMAEPLKNIEPRLQLLRRLRNNIMHPDSHNYSGSMVNGIIKSNIILLNHLFIAGGTLQSFNTQLLNIQKTITTFENSLLVLEKDDLRFLIERIDIIDVILINDSWTYLLIAYPITSNIHEQMRKCIYSLPFMFAINDLDVQNDSLSMTDLESTKTIRLSSTSHPDNIQKYKQFMTEKESVTEEDKWKLENYMDYEVGKKKNEFLYEWLYMTK